MILGRALPMLLPRRLQNNLDVALRHGRSQVPVHAHQLIM